MAEKIRLEDIADAQEILDWLKKFQIELNKSIAAMNSLSKESKTLDEELKRDVQTVESLNAATTKVTTNKKKLTETEKELQRIEAQQAKIVESAIGSYQQLNAQLVKTRLEYKRLSEQERNSPAGKEMLKNIQALDKKLKDFDKTMGQHQRNVGNYESALGGLKGGVMKLAGALGLGLGAFELFKKGMEATQGISDKLEETIQGVKSGTQAFFTTLVSGDWSNLITNMREAIKAGREYAQVMDVLEDKQRSLSVQEAKSNIEVQKLLLISKDATKTNEERIEATKQIEKIERDLAAKRVEYSKTQLDATIERISKETKLSQDQIRTYIEEYESLDALIQKGNEYNELVKKRNASRKTSASFQGQKPVVVDTEETVRLNELLSIQGESGRKAGEIASRYGNLGKAQMDELKNVSIAYYQAVSSADENLQKTLTRRASLMEQLKKAEAKEAKDVVVRDKTKTELLIGNTKALVGSRKAQYESELAAAKTDQERQLLKIRYAEDIDKLTEEQTQKAMMFKQMETDYYIEQEKKKEEATKKRQETEQEAFRLSVDLANELFSIGTSIRESQLEDLQAEREKKIKDAKDDKKAIEKINKEYDQKELQIKRRQAIADKNQALFNAAINTAVAITKVLGNPVLVALVAALGAAQAVAISSRPIPKFATGVKGFEGGMAIAGDAGRELVKLPDGNLFLTPDVATQMLLPKGTDIFTHNETEKMLREGITVDKWSELLKEQRATRQLLASKSNQSTIIDENGLRVYSERSGQRQQYIDKYFRGK